MRHRIVALAAAVTAGACAGRDTRGPPPARPCSVTAEPDSREPMLVQMATVDHFMCPEEPRLMIAVYDDFVLFRAGPACAKIDEPIRRRDLGREERRRLVEDIDVNPLLFQAQSPVEFCPACVGRQIDLIALRGTTSRFRVAVVGADSGAEPEARDPFQRDGALAAAALLRSLERLRRSLGQGESSPWTEEALVFSRLGPSDPASHAPRCPWPSSWRKPDRILDLRPGDAATLRISTLPGRAEFDAFSRRCPAIEIWGAAFVVEIQRTFPGQAALGLPFAAELLRRCLRE